MTLSITTIIVVTANFLTAVVAAGLLMLVLWQAPRQRMNQLFAVVMLSLGAYSVSNAFNRFIDDLALDPRTTLYIAVSFFGVFVVAMFYFASEFSQARTLTVRALRAVGVVLVVVSLLATWTDNVRDNIRSLDGGNYTADFTPFGYFVSAMTLLYMLVSATVLYRMPNERGRVLWPAPVLVIANVISATLIWPLVPIPLGAIFLAASALVLGLPVLRFELFNPLAAVRSELEHKHHELQEANRMKSQFLSNMSHELRTPLNSIIGYTQLVINGTYGALNDTQRDRLEKVIRNGHNLLNLINDVIDLSRIETGRFTLNRRPVQTANLLNSVLDTVEPLASQKGLHITRDFANAPPVYADEQRVHQIITNIVANAVKFTQEGGITVRAPADSGMVQFEIADTGIGIAPEQYELVFVEFEQLDNSPTREYEGTGLGMAITKRLVEMHGGRIWLNSTPGQGTTFYVTLPMAAVPPSNAPAVPPELAVAPHV
jgi:signal transduction histidine kinase